MKLTQYNIKELSSLVAQFLPANAFEFYEVRTVEVHQFKSGTEGIRNHIYDLETPVAIVNNWQFSSSYGCASARFGSTKERRMFVALKGVLYNVRDFNNKLELVLASTDNSKMEKDICAKIKQLEDEIAALKKQVSC